MAEASGIVPVHTQIDNLLTHDECMSIRGYFLDHVEKKGWMPAGWELVRQGGRPDSSAVLGSVSGWHIRQLQSRVPQDNELWRSL